MRGRIGRMHEPHMIDRGSCICPMPVARVASRHRRPWLAPSFARFAGFAFKPLCLCASVANLFV